MKTKFLASLMFFVLSLAVIGAYCNTHLYTAWVEDKNRTWQINVDVDVYIQRYGELEASAHYRHAGVITTVGKDFIEGKVGNSAFANNTMYADRISLSSDSSSPSAAWVNIPAEYTTVGLTRVQGAYASTGNGVWTISYQFTASGTATSVQLTGLHWNTGPYAGNLLCSDTFTATTLYTGDKITVTWTITLT